MPQKTRKEKIAAQERKAFKYTITETPSMPKEKNSPKVTIVNKESDEDRKIRTYFFQDLKRSVIFIVLILLLEIVLHFARINNYFS